MFGPEKYLENRNGHLYIDGFAAAEIASRFGTPLYVYSERRIRDNYRRIHDAFRRRRKNFRLNFAVKSNNSLTTLNILRGEGAGADCSCPAEIMLAKLAGFEGKDILYSGNYNTDDELEYGLASGGIINLDDGPLFDRLLRFGKPDIISFRINPGRGKGKYEGIVTAGPDAKFGMMEDHAIAAYRKAKNAGVTRFGLHMMTGSNVLDPEYFPAITEQLMDIAARISRELEMSFDFIDIGGGFGVPYQTGESELPIREVAAMVVEKFEEKIASSGTMGDPTLFIEPGRYIVCDAGVLLASVTHVKMAQKNFVGCDAGMNTLLRPALYGAYHEILPAGRLDEKKTLTANVTGQICENTDIMGKDRNMPALMKGDLLAFLNCGAYGYSMASNYNTRTMPAEAFVIGGELFLTREREAMTDFVRRQVVPPAVRAGAQRGEHAG